ncbi:3-oxoacyl-(acyl-carrier-protein) synthase 2 [Solidesulfovibrio carbinoliphilus subsp. oakridgensis]|uniref:3-oxoacyl-[acyl-carrier-protein] synthase 2 n=1 Tax=Solidesulfovibrio carbinoliphilus subsp. oakridgensis TaxID=694327 RepID=G7QA25_9BACT|nr:beta-ketoacyl-ACP synthase II [Solidesulfovibrio carbinoliphilus]EHJ47855.1 3-oxoacyl-(acyl-carrier-protein) synthase 2 [Solidesulfovibrio carbinoliphilus subsp. oakridgensis]
MTLHRVVVTGLSAITPIGNDLAASWKNLVAGVSGAAPTTRFDASAYDTRFACEVKDFDEKPYIAAKLAKRLDRFTIYALSAAMMLMEDAGYKIDPEEAAEVAVIIGCGMGGIETLEATHTKLLAQGPSRVSPFFIPTMIANMAAGQVSIATGAKGPNLCTTSACASGMHGIGYAYSDIKLGRVSAAICGGVESTITPLAVGGFNALKALSTRNDDPARASRPFDAGRDGFVIGEGCGLLLLESLEHAKARGARILAEVAGFGASGDAFHMTAPPEDGEGMALAMRAAIREAGMAPSDVAHINAHATSTGLGDACETTAIKTVFGDHARNVPVTANKSMIGHCLGAAGGIESVMSVKTIVEGVIPPTINLDVPDPACDLDYVPNTARKAPVANVLCNSFGFGGTNACMLYKAFVE